MNKDIFPRHFYDIHPGKLLWYIWIPVFFVLMPLDYGASKSFIELVAFVCLVVFIFSIWKNKAIKLDKQQQWLLAIIFFYALVSLWGYLVFPSEEATKKYYTELTTLIVACSIILLYPPRGLDTKKLLCYSLLLFIYSASASVIYDSLVNNKYRPAFGTNQVIPTTNVLVIGIFLCWSLLPKNIYHVLVYMLAGVITGYAVILSETRGAWLNFVVLMSLLLWLSIGGIKRKILAVFLLLVCMPLAYFIPPVQSRMDVMIEEIIAYKRTENSQVGVSSNGYRLIMWERSIGTLVDDPFKPRGLRPINQLVDIPDNYYLYKENFKHVHNEILQHWLQKGLFGMFAILLLCTAPLFVLSPKFGREGLLLTVGAIVAGLTDLFFHQNFPLLFYLITIAVLQKYNLTNKDKYQSDS